MIIKKIIITLISLIILSIFILFFYFSFFDTGFSFSIHYLKSKTIDDFRKNQQTLENVISYNDIVDNDVNNFIPKKGIFHKDNINSKKSEDLINQVSVEHFNSWLRSNGGNFSNKFSNYDQINKLNIKNLNLLWKYESNKNLIFKKNWKNNVETNPIFFDGLIYLTTPYKEVIAIDALSGKLVWNFNSLKKIDSRGISFWFNKANPRNSCIFVPIRDTIFCINYKTGKKIKIFGNSGFIKTGVVRSAPVIWKNTLIVATLDSLMIRGYLLPSGKLAWEIPIHPKDKNFIGGTPWGGISLDSKKNLLFVSTGNPRPALYGGERKGRNKNSNSILVFDLIKREIKWSFQEVSHDLWDYDIASPPLLASLIINNEIIDVVIVMTKIGNTLVFKRENGQSIFDINFKNAPRSDVFNEQTSLKQIFTKLPESTIKFEFNIEDLDIRDLDNRDLILNNIDSYKFGWFEPPSLEKTLLLYGLHGGAQWPGGVFDPYEQNLYIPVNQIPWKIRLFLSSDQNFPNNYKTTYQIYEKNCSSCHGKKRNGVYLTKKEKEIKYIPSLIDIYNNKYPSFDLFYSKFIKLHQLDYDKKVLNKIYKFFKEWDRLIFKNNSSKINFQWSQFLYKDNLPATSPPWGKIVSLNLKNGLLNWEVPNGYLSKNKIGTSNFGGIVVTKGGILFATGTDDNKVVALNSENGSELWSYIMDSAGSTSPMTFMWENKQILIVVASGGRYHNYKDQSGSIYAFSIK